MRTFEHFLYVDCCIMIVPFSNHSRNDGKEQMRNFDTMLSISSSSAERSIHLICTPPTEKLPDHHLHACKQAIHSFPQRDRFPCPTAGSLPRTSGVDRTQIGEIKICVFLGKQPRRGGADQVDGQRARGVSAAIVWS